MWGRQYEPQPWSGRTLAQVVDDMTASGRLDGIRTDAWTGIEYPVSLSYYLKTGHDGDLWVCLRGGPTGFESAKLDQLTTRHIPIDLGWCACAGTPNRWDTLIITAESLTREFGP